MRLSTLAFAAASAAAAISFGALTPMSTFGNGDGWRAPNEIVVGDLAATNFGGSYGFLGTGAAERGMAYNPVTGNLLLVSRQNRDLGSGAVNTNVRVLNGTTGADIGGLGGGTINTVGTFPVNMVGVADDGAIYLGNLSTSATSNFRVFRWANEAAAAPTLAYDGLTGVARTGDVMAVTGSGANTKIAAAGTTAALNSNFVILNTADGSAYTNTTYNTIAGTSTGSNDYRLGLTFVDSDTIIGNQGTNARITDFGVSATVTATVPLGAAQRPLDYAVIDGLPLMAVVDANSSLVQIFDITNPAAPFLFDQGNTTFGLNAANGNGNGVGNVQWGAINGQEATLYVMSTNQGIQAFNFRIPEPTCLSLIGLAGIAGMRRRRA